MTGASERVDLTLPLTRMADWQSVSPGIDLFEAASVEEFFAVLTDDDEWEWDVARARPEWVFRGHGNADWSLLPPAWRSTSRPRSMRAALAWARTLVPDGITYGPLDETGSLDRADFAIQFASSVTGSAGTV